ncbi:MAG: caspase family protein [Thiotrichaceae bacterium]|nr:caspase family protein [Thiotrichaceae bacterium]
MNTTFYALLVGINQYKSPKLHNLNACINDVKAIEHLLQMKFNVPSENILILVDEQATHQAIKSAFQQHLIARAQAWQKNQSENKPIFLFHFSGHGSYITNTNYARASGITEESIVSYDSRTENVFDIKDWELAGFISQLAQCGIDNTIISLDCCHSGSGTRNINRDDIDECIRLCPPDERPQPSQNPNSITRGGCFSPAWNELQNKHVLLAACRYDEQASENRELEHGLMTYFLVHELSHYDSDFPITYQDLQHRLKRQFEEYYLSRDIADKNKQSVQCEGNTQYQIFSGLKVKTELFFPVLKQEGKRVWIEAGFINGLTQTSLVSIYPEQQINYDPSQALAVLQVETLETTKCSGLFITETIKLPKNTKAAIRSLYFGIQRSLFVETNSQHLQDCLQQIDLGSYLSMTNNAKNADFILSTYQQQIKISNRLSALNQAQPIPFEFDIPNICVQLQQTLWHLSRFYNVLELHNCKREQQISMEIKLLNFDKGEPIAIPIPQDKHGQFIVPNEQAIVIEITNHSDRPLYFALFDLSYDWSISQAYPARGERKCISVTHTISLGLSNNAEEQFEFQLPNHLSKLYQILKVIATEDEACFDSLELPELGLPYQQPKVRSGAVSQIDLLLQQTMLTEDTQRSLLKSRSKNLDNQWTTTELAFWIAG